MKIKQLSVFIENKTGRINEVTRILGVNNINMTAFSLAENSDFGILRLIVSDVDKAVKVLKEAHFGINITEVVCFSCPNVPGSLSAVLGHLAKEDVFIEYMYAFSQGDTANVVIRPTDIDKCLEILKTCHCNIIDRDSLSQ
ncbi:amino acid-binding protein [Dysgonomonas sp. 216]|uniref:amino acid-binding protein n=1 Tax=Dysgonomonas sp. 216 TaxID=2302934 RepID=UPI0013D708A1|nr:amino acid-binding protein [Dysgonomonas sp. 216]NDW19834.1 amino acid-binding protein [Dysgonomonas sp. 216]